jgi:hypothetical protein
MKPAAELSWSARAMLGFGWLFNVVAGALLLGGLVYVVTVNEIGVFAIIVALALFTMGIGLLAASQQ